jgi:thymidylate synthase
MTDSWEDWEGENIVIPVLHVPNKEQIKRLEERKLIEESEIALMKDFFDNNSNTNSNTNNKETTENKKNTPKTSKQKENELKQKELSEKIRKKKEKEKKHSDVFGEVIHDKYDKYDDKTF